VGNKKKTPEEILLKREGRYGEENKDVIDIRLFEKKRGRKKRS